MKGLTAIEVRREFNKERIDRLKRGAKVYVYIPGRIMIDERLPVTGIRLDEAANAVYLSVGEAESSEEA